MSTHDYVIDNQNGAGFRSDLNNALAAIATNNSSATAPSPTYANMWWADTSSGYLKQRNSANTDWISVIALGATAITTSNIGSQSVNYATSAGNGGVTSVNGNTGAVTVAAGGATMARFTSNGSFTVPAGITTIYVTAVGGGGGGGGTSVSTSPYSRHDGGGGGGGGGCIKYPISVTPGQVYTVTVGGGGSGGSAGGGNGGTGGTTSFGSIVSCTGGGGGTGNTAGATTASSYYTGSPGNLFTGGAGGGANSPQIEVGSCGGGGGVTTTIGATLSNVGTYIFGIGGTRQPYTIASVSPPSGTYGGGGTGAISGNTPATAGANGASGLCVVEW